MSFCSSLPWRNTTENQASATPSASGPGTMYVCPFTYDTTVHAARRRAFLSSSSFILPLQIMKLEIEEISALRSFVFLWCGSGEGLDLGRMVNVIPHFLQDTFCFRHLKPKRMPHIHLEANCLQRTVIFTCRKEILEVNILSVFVRKEKASGFRLSLEPECKAGAFRIINYFDELNKKQRGKLDTLTATTVCLH